MQPRTVQALLVSFAVSGIMAACSAGPEVPIIPAGPLVETLAAAATPTPEATAIPTSTPTPSPTPTLAPSPTPTPAPPKSYLEGNTLFTVYGRALNVAPILGMLGAFTDIDDLVNGTKKYVDQIDQANGSRGVLPGIHLIYGLAIPCEPGDNCLLYLDTAGFDIVKDYIEPAAARGWQIILDSQNGRASPVEQVKRMIDKGYLRYENVHVALDPEFAVVPGRTIPGVPIGTIPAEAINEVQQMLDGYVRTSGLTRKKILIIHQFGDANVDDGVPFMIRDKPSLKTFPNVDLVIDADGFGAPDAKVDKYNKMTDGDVYPFIRWRGIKVFYPNSHERAGHYDKPLMDFETIFGHEELPSGLRMRYEPDVVVIA